MLSVMHVAELVIWSIPVRFVVGFAISQVTKILHARMDIAPSVETSATNLISELIADITFSLLSKTTVQVMILVGIRVVAMMITKG